ncbi:MAG: mandelate racemase/muconate lactonizing enzyme family protein [Saprospiraceae bacterium]|nr:mandelate racemase/muconate lactonizing enzyme family protein [Saprospiraceae bacterium]
MRKQDSSSNRRGFLKKASIGGLGAGLLASNPYAGIFSELGSTQAKYATKPEIKITDLKCAIIGGSPVVRITTNEGISGYGQAESTKAYLKPFVLFHKDYLIGEDPTNVERCMMKIRRMGSFKPYGSAVSIIEMALWDIAGKAASLPVYKLLGGKVRDRVRVYTTAVAQYRQTAGIEPADYADAVAKVKSAKEGFTIIKMPIGFHSKMANDAPNFFYGDPAGPGNQPHANRGPLTEQGLKRIIACVEAMKKVLGDEIGLAIDCGPRFMLSDAIRLCKSLEPYNLMWMEDLLTGDYRPYVLADDYLELTRSTTVPIHTGEQIYLRQNFRELIERNAIRVIGPDVADVGGMAEIKWIAEFADLHGIQMAPHGIFDGLIGNAAQVNVAATMPQNFIAFEYSVALPEWWYDIITGMPKDIVKDGHIEVWDRPGLGVDFIVNEAKKYLNEEDKMFFD